MVAVSTGSEGHQVYELQIYKIMHELPWITIFGSRVRRFVNDFHEWRSHESKSLANRITGNPQIIIQGNECIIYYLDVILCPEHTILLQFRHFSDLALWRHHSWSVMSRECGVLAWWRHIHRLFLHAQIGANAIFTNSREIDFSPPCIHGFACKKLYSFTLPMTA